MKLSKEKQPLISIIIPTFNRAEMLSECVQSCLDQTYQHIEVIIVDDGSSDNTNLIAETIKKRDPRVIYLKKEHNGLPRSLNFGFKAAKGAYLTWTADDNRYSPEAMEQMLGFLLQKKCLFVYCDYYLVQSDNFPVKKRFKVPEPDKLYNYNIIGGCFLYSRTVMEVTGDYDSDTELVEDYDYWIRVSNNFTLCCLHEPLYYFLIHKGSLSYQLNKEFDVPLIMILVKFKNSIINSKETTKSIINFIARINWDSERKPHYSILPILRKLTPLFTKDLVKKIYNFLIRIQLSRRIHQINRAFELKRISLQKTNLLLKEIIKKFLIIQ